MNAKQFLNMIQGGKKPVVRFKPEIEEYETAIDEGMIGRIVGGYVEGDCVVFLVDIKSFESINIPLMKPNYFDKEGNPSLKVIDTVFYPGDGIEKVWWNWDLEVGFEIIEDAGFIEAYIASGSRDSYAGWLEKQLVNHKEAWKELKQSLEENDVPNLLELQRNKTTESEKIRLGGKIEGVTHTLERIRTTSIHYSL